MTATTHTKCFEKRKSKKIEKREKKNFFFYLQKNFIFGVAAKVSCDTFTLFQRETRQDQYKCSVNIKQYLWFFFFCVCVCVCALQDISLMICSFHFLFTVLCNYTYSQKKDSLTMRRKCSMNSTMWGTRVTSVKARRITIQGSWSSPQSIFFCFCFFYPLYH